MRRLRTSALTCVLFVLPGCLTSALWDLPPLDPVRETTDVAVTAAAAHLGLTADRLALHVRVEFADRAPASFTLRPSDVDTTTRATAMLPAPELRRTLWLTASRLDDAEASWHAILVVAEPNVEGATLLFFDVDSVDPGASLGSPIELQAVHCTDARTTMPTRAPFDVAWRVAATPFTFGADVLGGILWLPIGLVIYVVDPGLLTGG